MTSASLSKKANIALPSNRMSLLLQKKFQSTSLGTSNRLDAISNERTHPGKRFTLLTFDHAHGTQPGDLAGQAGVMDDVNHGINILVGFGNFFQDAVARGGAQNDALVFEFLGFHAGVAALLGCCPGHRAAGAVAN